MARSIVFALAVLALLALAAVRLSKGERMPPPPSMLTVEVRPASR